MDEDSIDCPEVPGDNEVHVAGVRYEIKTHNKPEYVRTVNLDVKNIDENDMNARRAIYKAVDVPHFGEVKLFSFFFK